MRRTITCRLLVTLAMIGCASRQPPRRVAAEHIGPIRSRDVARGEQIFMVLCTACHGGRVNPRGYHWTPGQMRHQIREGNALMPPLPEHRLSDAEVEAVIAYLTTVGAVDGVLPPDPDAARAPPPPHSDGDAGTDADAASDANASSDADEDSDPDSDPDSD